MIHLRSGLLKKKKIETVFAVEVLRRNLVIDDSIYFLE